VSGECVRRELLDVAADPSLREGIDSLVRSNLPQFMFWASPGNWRWHHLYELAPQLQIAARDTDSDVIAAINALPVPLHAPSELAGEGYDSVLVAAKSNAGCAMRSVCLLSLSVHPGHRKLGLAQHLLHEVFERAKRMRVASVIVPLRPTAKARFPSVPMSEYIHWRNDEGQAFDPWIRTHLALGGSIAGVANRSLIIKQPVTRWATLTGNDMCVPGEYFVEGALSPVVVDDEGFGTYCEDNVWIMHSLMMTR
jgi:GNAT superfamily N-acetyltransferase